MDFLFFLNPTTQEILTLIQKANYSVNENIEHCRQKDMFGYVDFDKKFVICTKNIKNSGFDAEYYVNETVLHEAVHVAHMCNGYKPFNISTRDMPLSESKMKDVYRSTQISTSTKQLEHEAYWMEDKPDKVKYVIEKYCF